MDCLHMAGEIKMECKLRTSSNNCLKSQSLHRIENSIKDLASYPGFLVNFNLKSLLTLNVDQHTVTYFNLC